MVRNSCGCRSVTAHLFPVALMLLLAACAQPGFLRPAPAQPGMPHEANSAVASTAGIRLVAVTDAWHGNPANLEQAVIPLEVSIQNHGTHSLRVSYPELKLRGPALDYQPLPPRLLVGRTVTVGSQPLLVPPDHFQNFWLAPYVYPSVAGVDTWPQPWEDEGDYYKRQYAKWTVSLPTVDMIEQSLPEGVLDPGGRMSGFLYFQHLRPDAHSAELTFDLIDARSALSLGTLSIHFIGR